MEENKLKEIINRIYKILENNYSEETGFADKYVLTDIDIGLVSEYDFIEYNDSIIEDRISEMLKDLCGVELEVSLYFDEDEKLIALEMFNNLFIDNLSEVVIFLSGSTLFKAVKHKRAFCFPIVFTKEVNMNKACKWVKCQLLKTLTPEKEEFVIEYVDFGSTVGLLKGIYLTNKGESALDGVYNEVLDEIAKGKTEIVIQLKGNIESYNGLSETDMKIKLDKFFGGSSIELTAFDIRQTLEKSEDHRIELVVMIEDILTRGSYAQMDVINETYDDVIKDKLKDDKFFCSLLITDRLVNKTDNMLCHLANRSLSYLRKDIAVSSNVEWLKTDECSEYGQYLMLTIMNR